MDEELSQAGMAARDDLLKRIRQHGQRRTLLTREVKDCTEHLRSLVLLALSKGVSESECAVTAQVALTTVRTWRGK